MVLSFTSQPSDMPPRKDSASSDDLPPNITDLLNQLIVITTRASASQANINAQLAVLIKATENLHSKIDTLTETTAILANHITKLSSQISSESSHSSGFKTLPPSPTSTLDQFAPSSVSPPAPLLTNQFKPSTTTFAPTTKPSLSLHISEPIPASTPGESVIPKFGIYKGCLFRSKVAMGTACGNQLVQDVAVTTMVITTMVSGQLSHGEAKGIGWLLNGFSCTFAQSQTQWKLKMKDEPWLYCVAGRCDWRPPWPSTLAPSNVVVRLEWRLPWRYLETISNIIVRFEWRTLGRYAATKPNAIGRREWRPPWQTHSVLEDKNVLRSVGMIHAIIDMM